MMTADHIEQVTAISN